MQYTRRYLTPGNTHDWTNASIQKRIGLLENRFPWEMVPLKTLNKFLLPNLLLPISRWTSIYTFFFPFLQFWKDIIQAKVTLLQCLCMIQWSFSHQTREPNILFFIKEIMDILLHQQEKTKITMLVTYLPKPLINGQWSE